MGCQCAKNSQPDQSEITKDSTLKKNVIDPALSNQSNNFNEGGGEEERDLPKEIKLPEKDTTSLNKKSIISANISPHYNEKILSLINSIRQNPSGYSKTIEDSMPNITLSNDRLIYKTKVKVTLAKGRPAFEEASQILKQMNPMPPLILKEDITIPLPETKDELRDINFFKQKVQEIQNDQHIDTFFRDLVKEPETSILLMIVDDIEKNPGKKRNAILNPAYRYIGISSAYIEKAFVAYFSFSKGNK